MPHYDCTAGPINFINFLVIDLRIILIAYELQMAGFAVNDSTILDCLHARAY
jgi:hypothetical protein